MGLDAYLGNANGSDVMWVFVFCFFLRVRIPVLIMKDMLLVNVSLHLYTHTLTDILRRYKTTTFHR